MFDHFGAQIAYLRAVKLGFEFQVRTTRKIQRAARQALIHRQDKTEAPDAPFVAKRFFQRLSERQRSVFHGMVIIDMQIALDTDIHPKTAVGGNLIQHVVKKPNPV